MRSRFALALSLSLSFVTVAGCTEGLAGRGPRGADGTLLSGTYTYERPEVGSIDGCTATLIGPRLVLTAAHCIEFRTTSSPGMYNTFVIDDGRRTFRYPVDRMASYGRDAGEDDVALLHLSTAVPPEVATPARITARMPGRGSAATLFGYGCQSRGTSGTFQKQKFNVTLGEESYNLCPGDSGGPTMTSDSYVLRVNSAYLVGPGNDIFGDVTRHTGNLVRTATSWGETLSVGESSPGAPPTDPGPPPGDPGTPPGDPGTPPGDPGTPPGDPGTPPGDPGHPIPPPGDCASATTCEGAASLEGCGWCGATNSPVAVDACGYPVDDCPGDFRLFPEECAGGAPGGGGTSGLCICIDGVNFVGPGCSVSCPDASYCIPGTTVLECWTF